MLLRHETEANFSIQTLKQSAESAFVPKEVVVQPTDYCRPRSIRNGHMDDWGEGIYPAEL